MPPFLGKIMKLLCVLEPNTEGFAQASFGSGPRDFKEYLFEPDENDDLVGNVDDESHVAQLLKSGNFVPYGEHDFQAASAILESDALGDLEDDDDIEAEDDEVETLGDGAPIEALTPPSKKSPRKAREARAE